MIRDLLSFFTILPTGRGDIRIAARYVHLSPLIVGGTIGLLAGLSGLVVSWLIPETVPGLVSYSMSILLTGFHHLDGLLDFADACMIRGDMGAKLKAMKDKYCGSAAVGVGAITVSSGLVLSSRLRGADLLLTFLLTEVLSRLSLVVLLYLFPPSKFSSLGRAFSGGMLRRTWRLVLSFVSVSPLALLRPAGFLLALMVSIIVGLLLGKSSMRQFGGFSGDVCGATIEISKLTSLAIISSVGW